MKVRTRQKSEARTPFDPLSYAAMKESQFLHTEDATS